jgi:hypothetical protein
VAARPEAGGGFGIGSKREHPARRKGAVPVGLRLCFLRSGLRRPRPVAADALAWGRRMAIDVHCHCIPDAYWRYILDDARFGVRLAWGAGGEAHLEVGSKG